VPEPPAWMMPLRFIDLLIIYILIGEAGFDSMQVNGATKLPAILYKSAEGESISTK
jgi:hypothetical protein